MPHLGKKIGKKKNTIKVEQTEERTPVNDDGEDPIMEDREDTTEENTAFPESEERYASGDEREGEVLSIQTDKNEDALSTVEEQPSKEEAEVEPTAPVSHVSDKDETHSMTGESLTLDKSNTNLNEESGVCTSPVAFCGGLCFSG